MPPGKRPSSSGGGRTRATPPAGPRRRGLPGRRARCAARRR
ncbi:hypothetical protein SSAG_05662 [Streptomyces sp. Mg1]|nr:hypothetical protein SSAG_05662 [Streptomyces sp. Mg1]